MTPADLKYMQTYWGLFRRFGLDLDRNGVRPGRCGPDPVREAREDFRTWLYQALADNSEHLAGLTEEAIQLIPASSGFDFWFTLVGFATGKVGMAWTWGEDWPWRPWSDPTGVDSLLKETRYHIGRAESLLRGGLILRRGGFESQVQLAEVVLKMHQAQDRQVLLVKALTALDKD